MKIHTVKIAATSGIITITSAFTAKNHRLLFRHQVQRQQSLILHAEKPVGIFFGTSTGSTEEAAHLIATEFGSDVAAGPFEIDEVQGSVADEFAKYDSLIVGTPTWNTGADMERSGTGWDEIYYSEMQELNIAGKKVAVFGLGDSVSYSENYADATGELHDVFEALGCKMMGYTSTKGYLHDDSKAIRGEKFCGLLLDAVNQEELTEERVKKWVADIINEGILEGGSKVSFAEAVGPSSPAPDETSSHVMEAEPSHVEQLLKEIEESPFGYVAHYNPRTDKTMWISADGRSSYKTNGAP